MRRKKKESARPIHVCGSLKQGEGRGKMKKLIYLVLSVLCGISGISGIYDADDAAQTAQIFECLKRI